MNQIIQNKENIFSKISNFFKKIFFKENLQVIENKEPKFDNQYQSPFFDRITIKENEEEKRLKELQMRFDNGEIDEEDLSETDIEIYMLINNFLEI